MKERIKFSNEQDYISIMQNLSDRYNSGKKLNELEIDFFCYGIRPGERHKFSICEEYRYKDYYSRSSSIKPLPAGFEVTQFELEELDRMTLDWYQDVVLKTNHSSQTLQYVAAETRVDIKLMEKEFMLNGFLVKSRLYNAKLKRLLMMSRFIYFKVKFDFFLGYTRNEIVIPSIFGDVIFSDYSLTHVLFRHFAAGQKQYNPEQSFFSEDIQISSLHKFVFLILSRITKSGIKIIHPVNKAISFKYKATYYRLYLGRATIQRKGYKGNINILHVKSIFPINDQAILNEIAQLKGHQVSKNLIIFEQRP